MSILTLIIILCVIAFGFWANNTYVNPGILRTIVNIILIIVTLVIILSVAGIGGSLNTRI
jgi:hypothetical protein